MGAGSNLLMKKYYPWVLVALLWFVALLNYMDRQMLSTMQEAMKVDIAELNHAEAFGALMAVFLWIYGLVSPFAGIIADRVNRKWLVVGSIFVWSYGLCREFRPALLASSLHGHQRSTLYPSSTVPYCRLA